jgi:hypothetical protein
MRSVFTGGATAMANRASSYEIGYGKPPRQTRFKKGISGNPKGRPKASEQKIGPLMAEVMNREIAFMEGGKQKRASIMEVIITQLAARAIKGDIGATRMLLKLQHHLATDGELNPLIIRMAEGDKLL